MGVTNGFRPLPFGHSANAAVDIEGLAVGFTIFPIMKILLIPSSSFLKFTSRNFAKRKAPMLEVRATREQPGKGGSSTPTHQATNLRMRDGLMWILTAAI